MMMRRNLCGLLVLSLVIGCAFAAEENETADESDKKDEKTVSKRGVFHGHAHPAIVSASHYHLPAAVPAYAHAHAHPAVVPAPHYHVASALPAFARYPVHHHHKPILPVPVAPHFIPAAPAVAPHFHIAPGGASVTSYSVNYPRVPVLPRPVVPFYHKHLVPAYGSPVLPPPAPHHPTFHHSAYAPHYHPTFVAPKPLIPVAVPYPGIRQPKYPAFVPQRPVYGAFPSQFIPFAPAPAPTFIPVAVPSNSHQPSAINPGNAQETNLSPATQEMPQIPLPTQPSFVHQPTLQMPSMTSHGWRPMMMMTQHHHHPQTTQPTFTNKQPPYNYHAPAVAFNHDQASSTNDMISGHGPMSNQLAQQLALYQHQQQQQQYIQQQQQQENSFPYPASAETFQQNYDQASNAGSYHGLSSYQVPTHH